MNDYGHTDFEPEDIIANEVIEPPEPVNERSLSRRVALQVLYEVDSTAHPVGEVLDLQLGYHLLSESAVTYVRVIVLGVLKNSKQLDFMLQRFAPEWPLDQVAIIDRNILRIAVFEFGIDGSTPLSVAIDEAVELAKLFGAEGSARFVNGVLGSVAEDPITIRRILQDDSEGT